MTLLATLSFFTVLLGPPATPSGSPLEKRPAFTLDSVGVERREGKLFVLHRVNQGQTLYTIARRYNTSVEVIKAANPGLADAVQSNQLVRIPQPEPALSRREERVAERVARREEKAARKKETTLREDQLMTPSGRSSADAPATGNPKVAEKTPRRESREDSRAAGRLEADLRKNNDIHLVEPGNTLYSIAVKYRVLMADLRRWNNLSNDNILLGQALIVSEKGYNARQAGSDAATSVKAEPAIARKDPAPAESKTTPPPPAPERAAPKPEPARTEARPSTAAARPAVKGRQVAEIGMAERIEADETTSKFLALHRTAPVGSLVQVRNDVSNQSLWVKVIGRLPNTGVNERVLIKLSAKAFEKLSPNNQSFRAEVSYMIP